MICLLCLILIGHSLTDYHSIELKGEHYQRIKIIKFKDIYLII